MKMPIHDLPLRLRVIADFNLRERLRWETRNIWKMIAMIDQQAGHSTSHFILNEAAVFRRRGSMCRPGPSRASYFRMAKALLRISRSPASKSFAIDPLLWAKAVVTALVQGGGTKCFRARGFDGNSERLKPTTLAAKIEVCTKGNADYKRIAESVHYNPSNNFATEIPNALAKVSIADREGFRFPRSIPLMYVLSNPHRSANAS